jgi:hypothetical protein
MEHGREFMEAVDALHRKYGYETDFWTLSERMNIPVIQGEYNSSLVLPGSVPQPLITLRPEVYHGEWSFTRFHELAHSILRVSGIEAQLRAEAEQPEQFRAWAEAYCNFGAAQLQIPNPLLRRVLRRWDCSPEAVLALAQMHGVDLFDAMYRVGFGFLEDDAQRTVLLLQGSHLRKCVTTTWFPHSEGQRIPEVALTYPSARLKQLPGRFGWRRTLAVLKGGWEE